MRIDDNDSIGADELREFAQRINPLVAIGGEFCDFDRRSITIEPKRQPEMPVVGADLLCFSDRRRQFRVRRDNNWPGLTSHARKLVRIEVLPGHPVEDIIDASDRALKDAR